MFSRLPGGFPFPRRKECQNGLAIARDLKDLPNVVVPLPFPQYCTKRVHVAEWIEGIKLATRAPWDADLRRDWGGGQKRGSLEYGHIPTEGTGDRSFQPSILVWPGPAGPLPTGTLRSKSEADDVQSLVNLGIVAYLTQLLGTGLFHADPHPGTQPLPPPTGTVVLNVWG